MENRLENGQNQNGIRNVGSVSNGPANVHPAQPIWADTRPEFMPPWTLRCRPCPFIQILSKIYPDFIQVLSSFYPAFLQILSLFLIFEKICKKSG